MDDRKRIHILDLWRSLAIVCMVWYHYLYNQAANSVITWAELFSPPISLLQVFSSYSFIMISGISSHLSRSNLRRGAIVLGWALVISAVTNYAGSPILFGVLHFLGTCMILYGLLGKAIERRVSPALQLFFWPSLFFVARWAMQRAPIVQTKLLFPLGFVYRGFFSADYFPLLPWVFLFLFGTAIGCIITNHRDGWDWLYTPVPGALTWLGRHSLTVYLAHQPILYLINFILDTRTQ